MPALLLLKRFWYLIPILLLTIALGVQTNRLDNRTEQLGNARAFIGLAVDATRDATGNPKLKEKDVPAQISALGRSLAKVVPALEDLARRVDRMSIDDLARQKAARDQIAGVQATIAAREGVIARLKASAGTPRPPGRQCEPSDTMKELWK